MRTQHSVGKKTRKKNARKRPKKRAKKNAQKNARNTFERHTSRLQSLCNGIRYYVEREREGKRELQLWQPWMVERERWKGKRSDLWERAKGSSCFYLPRLTTLTTRYMYVIYPQDCHFSFKCFRSYEVNSSYPNHSLLLCISSVEEVPAQ